MKSGRKTRLGIEDLFQIRRFCKIVRVDHYDLPSLSSRLLRIRTEEHVKKIVAERERR